MNVLIFGFVEIGRELAVVEVEIWKVVVEDCVGGFYGLELGLGSVSGNCDIVQFNSGLIELASNISQTRTKRRHLFRKAFINHLPIMALGLASVKLIRQLCAICSTCSERGSKISYRSIKRGDLLSKSVVGRLELAAPVLAVEQGGLSCS